MSVNAFTSILRINAFVRRHLTDADTPLLNDPIVTVVNRDEAQGAAFACNAFYNKAISLAKQGNAGNTECANMGLINDVTHHEWGHGLDDYTGRAGGITDGAFSEGIGDILATYFAGNSLIGSGFFINNAGGIRQVANNKSYPNDLQNQVHADGEIIGGAFWSLREALIKRYGAEIGAYKAENLFLNHLKVADAYLESYEIVSRLDDDDGNPNNKSPNFCLINEAFAKHGLADLENNCTDNPPELQAPFDDDIKIGIESENGGQYKLMVATKTGVDAVDICLTAWSDCYNNANAQTVALQKAGVKNNRAYFNTKDTVAVNEQGFVTVLAKDAGGTVTAIASMKLIKK